MASSTRPNILYIHSHDTGRYVQPYGYQVPDAQHPAARGPGRALPQGVLRGADLLREPRLAADRPVLPQQRDARAGPPRLVAERLRRAHRPPAAPRRLPLGADRRAAHLRGPRGDRLRRGDRGGQPPRPGRGADHDRGAADRLGALLLLGRLLRDPPPVPGADLGPRLALLAAAGEPARYARDPPGHGGLQGQRALARPGDRRGAQRAARPRPDRADADHLHDRPRPRLPQREGDAVRPRDRRDAAHARPGRLHRRQGRRRDGQPPRHLPDALRASPERSGPTSSRAPRCFRSSPTRPTGSTTRSSPRSPSTRPTSPPGRFAPSAGSTSAASTTTGIRCSPTATTAPARRCWWRPAGPIRSSLPSSSTT